MTRIDFLLDDDGDLAVAGGDLVAGDSADQEMRALLLSHKGNWLAAPFVGVGVDDELLNDGNLTGLQQEVIRQFELDGFRDVRLVWGEDGQLQVTAE